jgi:hypothetical protein
VFSRKILKDLKNWADQNRPKPLIVRGARQVGKTTAVELFADHFERFIYLNLEKEEDSAHFKSRLPVKELLQSICLAKNQRINPGRTLLFLDEIQEVPEAVTMLRYFCEELSDKLHVIAAGSLLETMLGAKQIRFPVGRVQYMFLHPLTFEEYLTALGEQTALEAYQTMPFPDFAHAFILKHYHQYALVGGMPEIVATYAQSKDVVGLTPIYQALMTAYQEDVVKYAPNETAAQVIRHAIESAPYEAGNRIKFQGFGRSNYKSREVGEALRTLERAMLLKLVYPTTAVKPPAMANRKKSPRLQFLDTGLVNYRAGLQGNFFQYKDLHAFHQGRMAEHIVGQELFAAGIRDQAQLGFWVREKKQSSAEVDYLYPYQDLLIPVEVKAGKTGTLRSLHQFLDRADHAFAVRLYSGALQIETAHTVKGKAFTMLNLPYFLVGRLMEYVKWLTTQHSPT